MAITVTQYANSRKKSRPTVYRAIERNTAIEKLCYTEISNGKEVLMISEEAEKLLDIELKIPTFTEEQVREAEENVLAVATNKITTAISESLSPFNVALESLNENISGLVKIKDELVKVTEEKSKLESELNIKETEITILKTQVDLLTTKLNRFEKTFFGLYRYHPEDNVESNNDIDNMINELLPDKTEL